MVQIFSKKETNAGKADNSGAMKGLMKDDKMASIFDKGSKREDFFRRIKGKEITDKKMREVFGGILSERNRRFTKGEIGQIAKKVGISESKFIYPGSRKDLSKPVAKNMPSGFSQGKNLGTSPIAGSPAPSRYTGSLSH